MIKEVAVICTAQEYQPHDAHTARAHGEVLHYIQGSCDIVIAIFKKKKLFSHKKFVYFDKKINLII